MIQILPDSDVFELRGISRATQVEQEVFSMFDLKRKHSLKAHIH